MSRRHVGAKRKVPSPLGRQIQCPPELLAWWGAQGPLTPQPCGCGQYTYTRRMLPRRSHQYDSQWQQESEELKNHTTVYLSGVTAGSKQSASPSHGAHGRESDMTINVDNTHRNIERV